MVGFQEVVEIWEFTGSGDVWGGVGILVWEVEKGRLKMGFRRPF